MLRCLLPSVSPTLSNALLFTYSPFCYTGHCEIKNVGVHHNELSGFRFDDNAEGFVEGCESYNNKQYGMASSRSSSPTIVNSLFHGAESIGFHFSLKSSGSVKGTVDRDCATTIFAHISISPSLVALRGCAAPVPRPAPLTCCQTHRSQGWQSCLSAQ